jgi:predicted MFS family arabinose efflux permease
MPRPSTRLGVIFLTVFIDLAGFGLIIPVLPYYAEQFGASALGFGALVGVFSLSQFVATVVLGGLSDRIGRRPVLLASIGVGAAGYLLFGLASSYAWLFVARAIAGFAGGNISVAQAYIADVTLPSQRSRGMGLVGAAFGLGFIVGPALGAVASHYGGLRAVGFVAAGLCLLNLASAFLVLKESLRQEHRAARPLVDTTHLRRGFRDARFRHTFAVFGLIPFAFSGYVVAVPLFAEREFDWGSAQLGVLFTVVGVIAASVQGYLFGKVQRHTGDRPLIAWGTLGMAIGIAAIPLAGRSWEMFPCIVILALGNSLAAPALTGLISTLAGPAEQGAMLGAAQALSAIGRFSGPFLFGQMYDLAGPLATLGGAGGMMLLAWLVTLRIRPAEPAPAAAAEQTVTPPAP